MKRLAILLAACIFLSVSSSEACTTFSFDDYFGKSYDWDQHEGFVLINKANVRKKSLALKPTDKPFEWTSQYASLTFNQYGQEFPLGGINEAGLVVEIMVLGQTKLPPADQRPTINELQWIQYQLDSYGDVAAAVADESKVRISKIHGDVHYLMCDATNTCASFEYLNGKPEIHTLDRMPYPSLTNNTYSASLSELRKYVGFGGSKQVPSSASDSLRRFVVASARSQSVTGDPVVYAFETLSRVKQGTYSKWNMVYDRARKMVHFRTSYKPAIKQVSLAAHARSCKEPVLGVDVQTSAEGDLTQSLSIYTPAQNQALVDKTLGALGLPERVRSLIGSYPSHNVCAE